MSEILHTVTSYGMDIAVCAFLTFILTGIVKMPLKAFAEKSSNSKKYTRFITFLPVVLGFGVAAAYTYLENGTLAFDELFFTRWLSAVSGSLALYAFWEKFIPSKKKILEAEEIAANKAFVDEVQSFLLKKDAERAAAAESETTTDNEQADEEAETEITPETDGDAAQAPVRKKIVLRGGSHAAPAEE